MNASASRKSTDATRLMTTYVMPRADLVELAAERHEDVAGRQHHLDRDEEVEQVAGEERGGDPGGQHQVHRLEADVVALGAGLADGVHEHGEEDDRRGHEHDRRQPVGDERDADRRRPVAGLHGDGAVRGRRGRRWRWRCRSWPERRQAEDPLGRTRPPDEDRQRRGQQRQQHHHRQRARSSPGGSTSERAAPARAACGVAGTGSAHRGTFVEASMTVHAGGGVGVDDLGVVRRRRARACGR